MKVFNISSSDLKGRRFNGYDAHKPLADRGISTRFGSYWEAETDEDWARSLWPGKLHRVAASQVGAVETALGVNGKFQFWTRGITQMTEFKEADLIHLQIVHNHFLTLKTIRHIADLKPTVWTWHDLWPLTGHCIAPAGCARWAEGCGSCPSLLTPIPALIDRTASEFKRKTEFLNTLNADIHVSTKWMETQVRNALPPDSALRIHQFPFGIDTDVYKDKGNQSLIRKQLQISDKAFVVTARATKDVLKGFVPLLVALDDLAKDFEIVLVTVQDVNIAEQYTKRLRVIQMPWSSHETSLTDFYSVGDVFAMPSLGESFGLMALEAMSCSRPVITTSGTATAEVVSIPDLEVNRDNLIESIYGAIKWCIRNPQKVQEFGHSSRQRALTEYSMSKYIDNTEKLYRTILEKS